MTIIRKKVKIKLVIKWIIKCGVGRVYEARFRLAEDDKVFYNKANYKILSLMGTVFTWEFDKNASYKELVIKKNK